MKRICPPRPVRRGTTLIEVVLGLVVLSTLLVSVAMARGRFVRQWTDADRRLRLARAADGLMTQWMAGPPQAVPRAGRGTLDGGVVWRTSAHADRGAATLGAIVLRLDLVDSKADEAIGVSVDFLLPDTRPLSEVSDAKK